jgi:hypothetical protein
MYILSLFEIITSFDHFQNPQRKFVVLYLYMTKDYIEVLLFSNKMGNVQLD